jgi:hypothetical protein
MEALRAFWTTSRLLRGVEQLNLTLDLMEVGHTLSQREVSNKTLEMCSTPVPSTPLMRSPSWTKLARWAFAANVSLSTQSTPTS